MPHTASGMLARMQAGLERRQFHEGIQIFTTPRRTSSAVVKFRMPCLLCSSVHGTVRFIRSWCSDGAANIRASNSRHVRFKSVPRDRFVCLNIFVVFFKPALNYSALVCSHITTSCYKAFYENLLVSEVHNNGCGVSCCLFKKCEMILRNTQI